MITIITVTYNAEQTLERTLMSVETLNISSRTGAPVTVRLPSPKDTRNAQSKGASSCA